MRCLPRSFYACDALEVARELLGKVIVAENCAGRLAETETETEAYRPDGPAGRSET